MNIVVDLVVVMFGIINPCYGDIVITVVVIIRLYYLTVVIMVDDTCYGW